jgi:hypothetical protein
MLVDDARENVLEGYQEVCLARLEEVVLGDRLAPLDAVVAACRSSVAAHGLVVVLFLCLGQ